MKAHGLVGTFFITTSWIGSPSYLTQANLRTMAADGNEIGGHTVTHPDLTTPCPRRPRPRRCATGEIR